VDRLTTFTHFWQSGCARIGEPTARGWANSSTDSQSLSTHRAELAGLALGLLDQAEFDAKEKHIGRERNEVLLWRELELARDRVGWNPAHFIRAGDEAEYVNPMGDKQSLRAVLFPFSRSGDEKHLPEQVVLRCLEFMGAVVPGKVSWDRGSGWGDFLNF
jgi:NRDE-2, necessary for RNA interference